MTSEQKQQALLSPLDFAEVCSGGWYKRAPHLELLNEYLLRLSRREITRLMVFMPPRHSKSETISHFTPPWVLCHNPEENIILASYGQDLADHWGRMARDTLEEYGPTLKGISVSDDSSAAGRWQVDGHRGGLKAAGIGGAITGRGADWLIIDDAVKNSEEAWSATIQQRNIDWWKGTARTRLEPDGVVILMMTRWHQNDLAAAILKEEAGKWTVLSLPALAEADDPLGRAKGAALWPERYDEAALRDIESDVGDYYWKAEYQQAPALPAGFLYFDVSAIEHGVETCEKPRERIETRPIPGAPADGYVLVWERPQTGERYYIGADTADGKGEALGTWGSTGGPDRNAAAIYRARDDVQVGAIYGRQEEHAYARVLNEWGRAYNNALLGVERNRRSVLVALRELTYPNLYFVRKATDMHIQLPITQAQVEYGWNTDVKSRPMLLSDFREAVSTGALKIKDEDTWKEMQTFVLGDPPQAAPGNHDDRVFAHAIAWQVRKQVRMQSSANNGMRRWV